MRVSRRGAGEEGERPKDAGTCQWNGGGDAFEDLGNRYGDRSVHQRHDAVGGGAQAAIRM